MKMKENNLNIADSFSWDAKTLGTQLLLTQVTRGDLRVQYMQPLVAYCRAEYGEFHSIKW